MDRPSPITNSAPRLRVEGLTKRFGAVLANDQISFEVGAGEMHCLLGENGAGKSTLIGSIVGLLKPDAGRIVYEGAAVEIRSPIDAARLGIAIVQQHFVLIPRFSVTENITLGTRLSGTATDAARRIAALADDLGLAIDPDAQVGTLSVGMQQWVEILKALYLDARLLLLDEPTAVLTPQESLRLFQMIERLTARGIAVVLISHKFDEVMRADRVTVLRQGRVVATVSRDAATPGELASMMVGRSFAFDTARLGRHASGPALLEIRDLVLPGTAGAPQLSFGVGAGEILGIAGVAGNGQDALLEVLAGCREPISGVVLLDGEALTGLSPPRVAALGVGYVPSDRYRDGMIGSFSIADNLVLGREHDADIAPLGWLDRRKIDGFAKASVAEFGIVPPSTMLAAGRLSGGNAQKLILARELRQARRLLLCNQPTRGLDVAVIEFVRARIIAKRDEGCAILLASEDLDELFILADRILVMFRGEIMGIVDTREVDRQAIGLMMAGQRLP